MLADDFGKPFPEGINPNEPVTIDDIRFCPQCGRKEIRPTSFRVNCDRAFACGIGYFPIGPTNVTQRWTGVCHWCSCQITVETAGFVPSVNDATLLEENKRLRAKLEAVTKAINS